MAGRRSAARNKTAKRDRKGKERGQHTMIEGMKPGPETGVSGGERGRATRYARNALLLSWPSREWRRIAINFLSLSSSALRAHRSPSSLRSRPHPLPPLPFPPSLPPFRPSTGFRSFWFRSELIPCPGLGRVSFVRSFVRPLIRSGWLAGVTPCNRNLHPGSYYLHFNSARLLATAAAAVAAAAKRRVQT